MILIMIQFKTDTKKSAFLTILFFFNHKLAFAEWIIVLIVLGILLVIGIIVGLIVFKRRRAEQKRKKIKEEEDSRFGGPIGDVRLVS